MNTTTFFRLSAIAAFFIVNSVIASAQVCQWATPATTDQSNRGIVTISSTVDGG